MFKITFMNCEAKSIIFSLVWYLYNQRVLHHQMDALKWTPKVFPFNQCRKAFASTSLWRVKLHVDRIQLFSICLALEQLSVITSIEVIDQKIETKRTGSPVTLFHFHFQWSLVARWGGWCERVITLLMNCNYSHVVSSEQNRNWQNVYREWGKQLVTVLNLFPKKNLFKKTKFKKLSSFLLLEGVYVQVTSVFHSKTCKVASS